MLRVINNYNLDLQEGAPSEVVEFHFEDVNLNWKYHSDSRCLTYLTEYFRDQKKSNGSLKYLTLAAHYDEKAMKVFFNVQLKKQFVQRLYTVLPQPSIGFSGTLDSIPSNLWQGSLNVQFAMRDLINEKSWNKSCTFHNATFSASLSTSPSNVNGNSRALNSPLLAANRGGSASIRPDPTKVSGCMAHFNFSVRWKEPVEIKNIQISTQYFIEKLFGDEATKDLTIVAGNMAEIKCHTFIFSAQCPAFSRMLSSQTPMQEAITGRIEMLENSEDGVQTLIRYLYGMQMIIEDLSVDVAVELFQTAHKYDLSHLEGSLLRLFMKMDEGWFTLDAILELYLFVKKLDMFHNVRKRCVWMMTNIDTKEFGACEEFKKLDSLESTDIFLEIMDCFKKRLSKSEGRGVTRKVD